MKEAVLAVTLTGSCAILYLLYHLNSKSKERKNMNKNMKSVKSNSVCKEEFDSSALRTNSNDNVKPMQEEPTKSDMSTVDKTCITIVEVKDPNSNLLLKEKEMPKPPSSDADNSFNSLQIPIVEVVSCDSKSITDVVAPKMPCVEEELVVSETADSSIDSVKLTSSDDLFVLKTADDVSESLKMSINDDVSVITKIAVDTSSSVNRQSTEDIFVSKTVDVSKIKILDSEELPKDGSPLNTKDNSNKKSMKDSTSILNKKTLKDKTGSPNKKSVKDRTSSSIKKNQTNLIEDCFNPAAASETKVNTSMGMEKNDSPNCKITDLQLQSTNIKFETYTSNTPVSSPLWNTCVSNTNLSPKSDNVELKPSSKSLLSTIECDIESSEKSINTISVVSNITSKQHSSNSMVDNKITKLKSNISSVEPKPMSPKAHPEKDFEFLENHETNSGKSNSNDVQKIKSKSNESKLGASKLNPEICAKNAESQNKVQSKLPSSKVTSEPVNKKPSSPTKSKSKRRRRRDRLNAQSKGADDKEVENTEIIKLSESSSKESNSSLSCDSLEKSANKLSVDERLSPISNVSSLKSITCTPSPDLICTSDLERESSQTPEQETITSDSQSLISQASLDSGQGSIEIDQEALLSCVSLPENNSEQYVLHQFEVPQTLVGKLIGKKGTFLNKVKSATSTSVVLLNHTNDEFKLCSVEGKKWQVLQALDLIREHFPSDLFPEFTLTQVNTPFPSPQHQPQVNRQILQVELPPGVVLEVQASAVISSGEVWLQQPLHPTFSALQRLHQYLNVNYEDGSTTPVLPLPIPTNTICVCQIGGQWFRCQVIEHDEFNCTVLLLDIGGHMSLPIDVLRQIRVDYIGLPFQATQCYLYGIQPNTENGWEDTGRQVLQELVKNNIIYAAIAAYSQEGIPLVNLYQRQYDNQYTFINERLVDLGHAKWIATDVSLTQAS